VTHPADCLVDRDEWIGYCLDLAKGRGWFDRRETILLEERWLSTLTPEDVDALLARASGTDDLEQLGAFILLARLAVWRGSAFAGVADRLTALCADTARRAYPDELGDYALRGWLALDPSAAWSFLRRHWGPADVLTLRAELRFATAEGTVLRLGPGPVAFHVTLLHPPNRSIEIDAPMLLARLEVADTSGARWCGHLPFWTGDLIPALDSGDPVPSGVGRLVRPRVWSYLDGSESRGVLVRNGDSIEGWLLNLKQLGMWVALRRDQAGSGWILDVPATAEIAVGPSGIAQLPPFASRVPSLAAIVLRLTGERNSCPVIFRRADDAAFSWPAVLADVFDATIAAGCNCGEIEALEWLVWADRGLAAARLRRVPSDHLNRWGGYAVRSLLEVARDRLGLQDAAADRLAELRQAKGIVGDQVQSTDAKLGVVPDLSRWHGRTASIDALRYLADLGANLGVEGGSPAVVLARVRECLGPPDAEDETSVSYVAVSSAARLTCRIEARAKGDRFVAVTEPSHERLQPDVYREKWYVPCAIAWPMVGGVVLEIGAGSHPATTRLVVAPPDVVTSDASSLGLEVKIADDTGRVLVGTVPITSRDLAARVANVASWPAPPVAESTPVRIHWPRVAFAVDVVRDGGTDRRAVLLDLSDTTTSAVVEGRRVFVQMGAEEGTRRPWLAPGPDALIMSPSSASPGPVAAIRFVCTDERDTPNQGVRIRPS
jgi:hypothetical protein